MKEKESTAAQFFFFFEIQSTHTQTILDVLIFHMDEFDHLKKSFLNTLNQMLNVDMNEYYVSRPMRNQFEISSTVI